MNKKLIAIILAVVVLLSAIGVGIFFHFKNKNNIDDISYSSVEISPEDILFAQSSNKPNIELHLDEDMFIKSFGAKASEFTFRKADRIRIHFSDGKKFEVEPTKETVKITKDDDIFKIKIYIDDKEIFEKVNKVIRFDTACSVKIFFDEGTFNLNGDPAKAVTFILKCDSKLVSDVREAYMSASYENYVLKLTMTDSQGKEILFTSSGNTKEHLIVFADKANKHNFNNNLVATELFKTAIINPSESFEDDKIISVYVPDGFFVSSQGNRIKVVGLKNSDRNIRLAKTEEVVSTTAKQQPATEDVTSVTITESEGVYATATFEKEFPTATGEVLRNLTDLEVIVPVNADWQGASFTGKIITSEQTYDIPSTAIVAMEASTVNGYMINISVKDAQTCEIGGVELDGILYEEEYMYNLELTATDSDGNVIANISTSITN